MSEPRPPVVFDRVAHCYDATRGGEDRGARIAADIAPWLAHGPVLEVGVGTGVVAGALMGMGHTVIGVDLSRPMLDLAVRRLGPGRVVLGDARALPVATAAVSSAFFVHALHVVGDLDRALSEAARVVRPGGRVIATHGGAAEESTDLTEAMAPAEPLRPRGDLPEAVAEAGDRAGLVPAWSGDSPPTSGQESPRELAALVRERAWAWLWDVDDATWEAHVAPALDRLAALPDQDRPRRFLRWHRMTVWDRPR